MGAAVPAAAIIARERHIVDAFRRARATSPGAAVTPESLGVHERLAFARLGRRAILREAGEGRFYLDEPSWEAARRIRIRVALVAFVLVLVLAAIVLLSR
jgi:hypothetical protein